MRFGSVCSGIEAASVAWHPLGWQAAWLAEIEPFPAAVLAHHYPEVPNLGDMTALPARIRAGEIEAPDVFCGGTPCQAFSVAGLRRSLDDARGNLSLMFCEIADAIDAKRNERNEPATIVFWENVPGVLSTKDNAFGCFLAGLAGEDAPLEPSGGKWTDAGYVSGPKRAVAWRTLDAQYFGLAQRRRRVFVVASAREGFDPAAVLFEFEGVRRDTAPSREAREVAPTIPSRSTAGGGLGTDWDCDGGVITKPYAGFESGIDFQNVAATNDVCGTLMGEAQKKAGQAGHGVLTVQPYTVANTMTARMHKGINTTLDEGQTPVLALQDVSGREKDQNGCGWNVDGVSYTLDAAATQGVAYDAHAVLAPVAFHPTQDPISSENVCHSIGANKNATAAVAWSIMPQNSGRDYKARQVEVLQPLMAAGPQHGNQGGDLIMQPVPMVNMQGSKGNAVAQADGPSFTLNAMHGHDVHAILAPTLTASNDPSRSPQSSEITAQVAAVLEATAAVAFGLSGEINPSIEHIGALDAGSKSGGGQPSMVMPAHAMQVRRLTPMECERLQGFPDGYTAIPWRKKPASECPDGPRYKALGNSWAVPVVRWIGERIQRAVMT